MLQRARKLYKFVNSFSNFSIKSTQNNQHSSYSQVFGLQINKRKLEFGFTVGKNKNFYVHPSWILRFSDSQAPRWTLRSWAMWYSWSASCPRPRKNTKSWRFFDSIFEFDSTKTVRIDEFRYCLFKYKFEFNFAPNKTQKIQIELFTQTWHCWLFFQQACKHNFEAETFFSSNAFINEVWWFVKKIL